MNSTTAAEHATEARPMRGSASSVLLDEPDIFSSSLVPRSTQGALLAHSYTCVFRRFLPLRGELPGQVGAE